MTPAPACRLRPAGNHSEVYRVHIDTKTCSSVAPLARNLAQLVPGSGQVLGLQQPARSPFCFRRAQDCCFWQTFDQIPTGPLRAIPAFEDDEVSDRRKPESGSLLQFGLEKGNDLSPPESLEHRMLRILGLHNGAVPTP